MDLRRSRKILCFLLTMVMAIGMIVCAGSAIAKFTICNGSYMEHFLLSDNIMSSCDKSYNASLEALEEETGIPARVYKAAQQYFVVTETTISRIYGNQDPSLLSKDKTETYEKLCREYLDGNNIKYKEEDVQNAAEKATEIYASCYGISNSSSLYSAIVSISERATGIIALGMLLVALPLAMIVFLFQKKERLIAQIVSSFSCTGYALTLFGLIGIVFGIGNGIMLQPEIYARAVEKSIRLGFLFIMLIGIAVSALFIFIAFKTNEKLIEKRLADN